MPEKILVVDDDVDTLRLVGLMLQRQGYEIAAASSGRQALSMARSEDPDLIILDVMMPDMDGYEVTRRLRTDQSTASIPIIMFTAKTQIDDKVTGFEAGADDYLTKPTQPRELFAHVKAVLARTSKARTPAPHTSATPPSERGHVVGVLAAKGGLGVTTVALNLGVILRSKSLKNVIVAEYRPGQGTIGLTLGYLKPNALNELLDKKPGELTPAGVEQVLINHNSGVQLLLASYEPSDARYQAHPDGFLSLTKTLAYMTHYLILDLGSALPPLTDKVLSACDELIVLVEPHPHTILQTKTMLKALNAKGFGQGRVRVVLVNRIRSDVQTSWNQAQEELEYHLSVVFTPAPEILYQAGLRNIPVVLYQSDSLTTQQFNKLADLIVQPVR
jgi:CheY-like chemotaxis protein